MARHKCDLYDCDGTRLGHELARDFPEETRQVVEGLERLIDTEHDLTVDPANLQVDPLDPEHEGYKRFYLNQWVSEKPEPLLCPECTAGKTVNCVGQALDPDTDEFVPCEGGS